MLGMSITKPAILILTLCGDNFIAIDAETLQPYGNKDLAAIVQTIVLAEEHGRVKYDEINTHLKADLCE